MPIDTQPSGTLLSTITSTSSSQQASATLWQLLLCTRKLLQQSPDHQAVPEVEGAPHDPQQTLCHLMLQCLQDQQPGWQHGSGCSKEWTPRNALTSAFSGLLQTSLCLLAATHDSEHLSLHKPLSRRAWEESLSNKAHTQLQGSSAASSASQQQVAEQVKLIHQLQANVKLLVMQLPDLWNLSPCALHVRPTDRLLLSRPDESTQPLLVWKSLASAMLHMHTASVIASRLTCRLPRITETISKNKQGNASIEYEAVPGVLQLGVPILATIAHSAARAVLCWLHDSHAMLCAREHAGSNDGFSSLQEQICLLPVAAFQVLHLLKLA
jgi:hypothetical protein